jgi:hypothetical protein
MKIDPLLLSFLFEALRAEHGIVIADSHPISLRQRLYAAQRSDPQFKELQFIVSPTNPNGELWVTKNQKWQAKRNE